MFGALFLFQAFYSQLLHARKFYWLNRKNCCVPEMGLVTVFWPLMTTGDGKLVFQTAGETRFVVDCNLKPVEGDGQETTTLFVVVCATVSDGGTAGYLIVA